MLQIRPIHGPDYAVLALSGNLYSDPDANLWKALHGLVVQNDQRNVLLDLSGVRLCDSVGISELLHLQLTLESMSGKLVLFAASPLLTKMFEITKINRWLNLAKDQSEAVCKLNGRLEALA